MEKALTRGYVDTVLTTCLASGAPGTGKTHLQYLLYQQLPPDTRISTAVIEEARRAKICNLDGEDPEDSQWKQEVSAEVESTKDELSTQIPHLCELEPFPSGIEIATSHVPETDGPQVKPMPQKPQ